MQHVLILQTRAQPLVVAALQGSALIQLQTPATLAQTEPMAQVEMLHARHVEPTVMLAVEAPAQGVMLDMALIQLQTPATLAQTEPMAQVEMLHARHVELTVMLAAVIIHVLVASLTMGLILSPLLVLFALAPTQALEVIPHVLNALVA